jgi:hypothetical protein
VPGTDVAVVLVSGGLIGGPTGELPHDGIAKGLLVGRFQCSSTGDPPMGMETLCVTGTVGVMGFATGALGDTRDIGDNDRGEP